MITPRIALLIVSLIPLILEAALRALLAALAVWAGLRLLRVANVFVQKAAWGLVLVAAFAMPMAPHWNALPALAALRLPALAQRMVPSGHAAAATPAPYVPQIVSAQAASPTAGSAYVPHYAKPVDHRPAPALLDTDPAPAISTPESGDARLDLPLRPEFNIVSHTAQPASAPEPKPAPAITARFPLATAAWLFYLGIVAALVLRIAFGLASALRLWVTARPIADADLAEAAGNTPLRFSPRVASPINIGSGILLPTGYAEWDEEKLRVVLAHERCHIRQGDFYLQLLAGLYASFFWFSPLGWWLKRKLTELGEAISDRAGLEEAASRSSYAQLLLEFAALPRPTLTGVAMARTSHLALRIERLLNESSFRQAFAAGGRRTLLAFLLVPVALFAATAMVRVEAAASPVVVAATPSQTTGQATPEQVTEPAPAPAPNPEAAPMPPAPGAGQPPAPPAPVLDIDGVTPPPPPDGILAPMPPIHVRIPREDFHVRIDPAIRADMAAAMRQARQDRDFAYLSQGEPYALVGDPGSRNRFVGDWDDRRSEEIEKARKVAHGHFLWFRHEGKSYVIDDPATVAQVEAMNKPMDELGNQMKELGEQMRTLGRQQRAEGQKMRDLSIPTPDISKQLAELTAAADSLKAKQGGTISQKDLGELQREIGRIQGDLGALQGKLISQQMNLNGLGKFGEEQGKLGGQMGELGGKMGKLAQENREKIQAIIDGSLKNGKARPVE